MARRNRPLMQAVPALVAGLLLPGLVAGGCGGGAESGSGRSVTVFAAASLREPMEELARRYEAGQPGLDVMVQFDGSSSLARQVGDGAPADVFASADSVSMDRVVAALGEVGVVVEPRELATNRMAIAVPAGNPGGIVGLVDFGRDEADIGLCAEPVPCGRYGREVLAGAGVDPRPDTEEPDVRTLLAKVAAGELDAALVYATDVRDTDGPLEAVPVPEDVNVTARYPVAALTAGADAAGFVAFLVGEEGRSVLADAGFGLP